MLFYMRVSVARRAQAQLLSSMMVPDSFPSCDAVHVAPSRTLALAAVLDLREADLEDPLPDHLPEQPLHAGAWERVSMIRRLAVGCWLLAGETWRG